ncbi:uncharacterized protein [Pleurodeles waltl]|uniref:uncharacterized protein n=1 Tax=Pleurodeles waltl TaxID=8319 RepID=UPI0037095C92
MAGPSDSLLWLENAKFQIENLQEWKEFTVNLFDAVQQQMDENHVNFFTDLSETEKAFVLQRAAKAIRGGELHNALMAQINHCLEEQIYSHVSREMQDSQLPKTKSDLVLGHLREGVVHLLEKRPDLKGKLHALFNQPLPTPLRGRAWRLYLSNTKARMEYLSQVAVNKAKSSLDREISLQCVSLLSAEETIQHLKDNTVSVKAMRNALSYSHKFQKLSASPSDSECLLIVPLVQAVIDTSLPTSSVDTVSALLVEEYLTFIDLRPMLLRGSPDQSSNDVSSVYKDIALLVNQMDQKLSTTIQRIYSEQADQPEESLQRGVQSLLQPVMQRLFTGYLQMKTLLYIWDQYIIGLDQPAYNCLPAFGLTFIMLLRDHLKGCHSPREAEAALKTHGPVLSIQEFQAVINKHFFRDLYSLLNKEDMSPLIIHDPTQVTQWSHATRTAVLPRTRPQDRRQAREERDMLRRQYMEKIKEAENQRLIREEEQKRQEELRLQKLLEDTRETLLVQKSQMEEQLSQEKQSRYELQRKAEEQIAGLQAEIRRLRELSRRSPDRYSLESLTAPPPSEHSRTPTPPRSRPLSQSPLSQRASPAVGDDTHQTQDERGKTAAAV